ncbi:MAG TPA: hypothetical protein PK257_00345 [Candidatus Woesebacteria bacterium]|nr:hypothetical protein [Candidatus Woesebacteria bacterium]
MDNQINPQEPTINDSAESIIQDSAVTPPSPTPETPTEQTTPVTEPEPVESTPESETEIQPQSTEQQLQDLGITPPLKTGGGFFKGLFVVALIIFVFVMVALGLVFFKNQKNIDNSDSNFDTAESTPIPASGICFLNDKTYQIGESFASADGCNTCTCESADVITCTEKACPSTITPTKTATATPTVTKSATSSSTKN